MNALLSRDNVAAATKTLKLFCVFHLNLAFSSIEENQRDAVIARCYWPLLKLAEKFGPIGIEASGFTLEEIAARDPTWVKTLKGLLRTGQADLIGSGYAQIIGPLVPARVTRENLAIGNQIYERLLDVKPRLALVNEQAYSAGLVGLYLDAGFGGLLMDWDNPAAAHPQWSHETRYLPQRALGADGRSIGLVWTNTVAFQKLQRFAHGDIELDGYLDYLHSHQSDRLRALCVYASDAEIFDFRPGRYKTEEKLACQSEWLRLEQAFAQLSNIYELIAPSTVMSFAHTGAPICLETAAMPVPVKKQRKYNLARWAVTGRDDLAVNAACERIYRGLISGHSNELAWRELCRLWASDNRTHITRSRWRKFVRQLNHAENTWAIARVFANERTPATPIKTRYVEVQTPHLTARLDRRRGLALQSVHFSPHKNATLGGLAHGHFDDIALQADWYTGDCVFEAPGEHKITDLEWCSASQSTNERGDIVVSATIPTPNGSIEKTLRFAHHKPRIDFDITFNWKSLGRGSLRLGHFTLLAEAFNQAKLELVTHNGGNVAERFKLSGQTVEHGAPVSFLVSSSYGFGMTEGWAEIGDETTRLRIEVDRTTAPLLGMLTHRHSGEKLFCQVLLSALELDDTRKPTPYRNGPQRFCFSVSAAG